MSSYRSLSQRHRRWRQAQVAAGACCHYCGERLTQSLAGVPQRGTDATYDHLTPRSAGGDSSQDNLVLACYSCNQQKGCFVPPAAAQYAACG